MITDADPYSATGLAHRCGRLSAALELLLEVVDDCPVVLDQFHTIRVKHARRALAEAGVPLAVTT